MVDAAPPAPKHRRRHLSLTEWRALLAATQDDLFDTALLHALYGLGLRACEVGRLTLDHAKELHRGLFYTPRGKGGRAGWLEIDAATSSALRKWIDFIYPNRDKRKATDPIFPGERFKGPRRPLGRHGVYRAVQRLGRAAGIPVELAHPHAIRHGLIMHIYEAGMARRMPLDEIILALAARVGHATAQTTLKNYISETKGAKKLIRDVLGANLSAERDDDDSSSTE